MSSPVHRFAPRGAPDREALERLAASGATLREMAEAVDRSSATVKYWLDRWEIARVRHRGVRQPADPSAAPKYVTLVCRRHGDAEFVLEGRGAYRCKQCRQDQVAQARRDTKLLLVDEAGGACAACGYDACVAALQFHHLDPSTKSFALSHRGLARSLAAVRAEAAKCVLLCANCHAEVEAGFRVLEEQEACDLR